jgi:hypothetical protein
VPEKDSRPRHAEKVENKHLILSPHDQDPTSGSIEEALHFQKARIHEAFRQRNVRPRLRHFKCDNQRNGGDCIKSGIAISRDTMHFANQSEIRRRELGLDERRKRKSHRASRGELAEE